MRQRLYLGIGLAGLAAVATSGCSSSSSTASNGGGQVAGLTVASQVSVVDAQQAPGSPKLMGALQRLVGLANVPTDSAYSTDKTNVYVNEKAGEAFKTVNMILCMVDQTKYADMVNKGFYKAMVNSNVCQGNDSADKSGSSAQGDVGGAAAPSYDTWTVKSERASATSDQVLTAYVHMAEGGPTNQPMTVEFKMIISEGSSTSNPVGIFTANYRGYMDATPNVNMMKGVLKTELVNNKVVIKFAETEYDVDGTTIRRINKAAYQKDATTGQGSAALAENYQGNNPSLTPTAMDFAYTASEFKRESGASSICLDRSKFESSAWRYGVYSSSGARKNVNAGFSINTKSDGSGAYGYLGYYGLNLPPGATIVNETVYKKVWSNGTETTTPYSIFAKGGKLKKHVKKEVTLADIMNIPLEGGEPGTSNMVRVIWNGTALKKIATAVSSFNGPPAWTDVTGASQNMTFTNLPWGELNYYSQALSGQVRIKLSGCTPNGGQGQPTFTCTAPSGTAPVVYFSESTVMPGDTVPSTLACFDNCPAVASGDVSGVSSQTAKNYAFNAAITGNNPMILMDGSTPVLKTVDGSSSWGFNSGPLFDVTYATVTSTTDPLACDWSTQNNLQVCGWKAWSALSTFYTWETGKNSWNQFTAAMDASGVFVKFDPPLAATYVHSQSDATAYDFKYDGTKFFLQYTGFGDLQGIPGKCFNPDTGTTVTNCNGNGLRWVPEFTIPADAQITIGGIQYLVKPLEMEQRMKVKPGGCAGLTTSSYASSMLNMATDWVDPALGAEPVVTASPKVIGGVVQ